MALSLAVIFNMVVNLFFYSAQGFVNDPVVFFVFKADFADERHHHSETPTDQRNHNFSRHVMPRLEPAPTLAEYLLKLSRRWFRLVVVARA